MKFEKIPKTNVQDVFGYVDSPNAFYSFVNEFNVVGVNWSQPTNISANYLLRILQGGSSARARGYGKNNFNEHDESSNELSEFYTSLLDHGALWKLTNGNVLCTAMPYGNEEDIIDEYQRMVKKFQYPDAIKMNFLGDKYRFRPNGDHMIVIYYDLSQDEYNDNCSNEELCRKAILHSGPRELRYQRSSGRYNRDLYISEFAKRRACGVCQLCGNAAPFLDYNGKPFLETHHIIPLAEGGADSVENTVALCPNCHRKMHILALQEDVEKLLWQAKEDMASYEK